MRIFFIILMFEKLLSHLNSNAKRALDTNLELKIMVWAESVNSVSV